MAGESESVRRRQSSTTSEKLPIHIRQPSNPAARAQPKSSHVGDSFLQDFLNPSFDPATYLNASLSPLQQGGAGQQASRASDGQGQGQGQGQAVALGELSSEAQALISQLNAHTTRLSGTLTQLTDDILRSGSRLAYEVELLRGETLSFAETMNESLRPEVEKFLPEGLPSTGVAPTRELKATGDHGGKLASPTLGRTPTTAADGTTKTDDEKTQAEPDSALVTGTTEADGMPNEPTYVRQLRTLTLVRSRLDTVIKTFGEAMNFTFPPSELSVGSGFLSVSAPEPGTGSFGATGAGPGGESGKQQHSTEEKGQQVLKQLREEVSQLLKPSPTPGDKDRDGGGGDEDVIAGIERAAERVEELKELTVVWKGTAEEKGRVKFIESLARMVEERHKELLKEAEAAAKKEAAAAAGGARPRKGSVKAESKAEEERSILGGYGLMSQLQKLRSGL